MRLGNKLLEDAFLLLGGNVINAGCQLAVTLLLANSLPAESWGAIAVIISYVLILETLFATKNWQLVTSHAFAYIAKSPKRFCAHFSAFFATELITNVLATILALIALPIASELMNLPPTYFWAGVIYSFSILFRFSGSAGAILRLSNKFLWQSAYSSTLGIARLVCVAILLNTNIGKNPTILLGSLAAIESLWHIGLTSSAWIIIKRRGVLLSDLKRGIFRRLMHQDWKLVATSHSTNLVKVATRELDILVVSAFSGPDVAGVIKVFKSILRATLIVSDPLANAAFPHFIAFQNQTTPITKLWSLVKKLIAFGTIIATISLISIASLISILWQDYTKLPMPTQSGYFLTYAVGIWIAVAFFCLPPANLSLKRYGYALKLNALLAVIYITSLMALTPVYGAVGAGISFAIMQMIWAFAYLVSFDKLNRTAHSSTHEI